MAELITIKTAQLAVGHNSQVMRTGSIGSCLVIILYDVKNRLGGLAHAMLPTSSHIAGEDLTTAPAKYIDQAIINLINGIEKLGGDKSQIVAKLVGGATMFKALVKNENSIGNQNISFAKSHLSKLNIPIVAEDVGGSSGKMVEFNLVNGIVDVFTKL